MPALGQPIVPPGTLPTREELDPATRTEDRVDRADLFAPPVAAPCPFAGSDLQFRLDSVEIAGRRAEAGARGEAALAAALERTWAEFRGRDVSLETLCTIRDRIAATLFDRGRLARVEIPEQRIADGRVQLEVIEARVETVRVIGIAGPVTHKVDRYAAQIRGMNPFDLRKAQRALLLASELPGVRLRTVIRPGASGRRGAIDIELLVERDPVQALVNLQNLQSRQTGRWAALARADFNSMTALGEQTTLVVYRTIPDNEQFVVQAREVLRLGGNGLRLSGGLSYGESRPGDVLEPLNLRSTSVVGNLELAWPLVKRRSTEVELSGGFDIVSQRTQGPGFGLIVEDQLRVLFARAVAVHRFRSGNRLGQVGGDMQLRQGVRGLGASDRGDPFLSRLDGRADAFVARFGASAVLPVGDRITLSARGAAQLASKPLLAYEELTVGNLTIGRGYDPATVAGDEGIVGAFDARFGPFPVAHRVAVSPYGFFDVGHVSNRDQGGFTETVTSAGAGVIVQLPGRLAVDLAWARPFDRPLGNPRPPDRLLLNASIGF
ncbi:MAG: ShlB/FhaC/HecB family hemolysin secretion/activation protein [Thermaurantiacus sp.]